MTERLPLARLRDLDERFQDLQAQMEDPVVLSNHEAYTRLNKEAASLRDIVEAWRRVRSTRHAVEQARNLLRDGDAEIRELAQMELDDAEETLPKLEHALLVQLLPRDPLDEKDVILEIRAGTGGDESSLFVGDLLGMYTRFAQLRGWRLSLLSESPGTVGGFKEVIAQISGDRVYSALKYESGVHRVQRVPATEAQGRIHTSAVTVAILAEAEEVEIEVREQDLRIDTYRASGAGGQHVNRTDSAVRITHLPTGIVVACQDERSQIKNRARAMTVLRSRILDAERQRADAARADDRKSQVGSGDRSERIRTYNFPQNRLTDHRIGLTLYKLDRVMLGECDELIDALSAHVEAERLQAAATEAY